MDNFHYWAIGLVLINFAFFVFFFKMGYRNGYNDGVADWENLHKKTQIDK